MNAWLVFKQDSARKPHQMVGSVRASDAELALLQARTVFARRPKAISMWVAPKAACLQWTKDEAAQAGDAPDVGDTSAVTWQVFRKVGQRRSMTFVDHVGEVVGASAENAIRIAIDIFSDKKEAWVWMVVPDAQITRSDPADNASWFDTALDKTYKQQSAYGFVGGTRARSDKKGQSN